MGNGSATVAIRVSPLSIDWVRTALYAVIAAAIFYAFWMQPALQGLVCYNWLIGHWSNVSNYSHGPLIPLIASFLLWWNVSEQGRVQADWRPYWRALAASGVLLGVWVVGSSINDEWEKATYYATMRVLPVTFVWQVVALRKHLSTDEAPHPWHGPLVMGVAMILYWLGIRGAQPRVASVAGLVLMYGLVLSLRGGDVFRKVFFPISFLFLMVPLDFLDSAIGFPLRMFVAKSATIILNWLGIEAVQRGSGIISSVFRFDVADPCSGIRSLMALTTVTAAYGYLMLRTQWKRWLLFLSALPLAVLGNLARVISIALVAQVYGQDLATKVYHDWSGFILFPVALAAMVLFGLLLNFNYRGLIEKWTQPIAPPVTHE